MPEALGRFTQQGEKQLSHSFQLAEGSTELEVKEVWDLDSYRMGKLDIPKSQVVDVGANVGAFTVLAAELGAQQVLAFEPHPQTYAALEANVRSCRHHSKVRTYELAVSGLGPGIGVLQGAGGGAHLVPAVNDGNLVQVVNINEVMDPLGDMVVLKLDCEGEEYSILHAITPANLAKVNVLVMEWHGPGMPHLSHLDISSWGAMVTRLADYGDVITHGHPDRGGLLWVHRYSQGRGTA